MCLGLVENWLKIIILQIELRISSSTNKLLFWPSAPALLATFRPIFFETSFCHLCPKNNFSPFCFASPEIIGSKFITDRQILWHHIQGYADFFFQLNLLPPYSLRSQGDNKLFVCYACHEYGYNSLLCTMPYVIVSHNHKSPSPYLRDVINECFFTYTNWQVHF